MAIETADLKTVYKFFIDESKTFLSEVQSDLKMTDEAIANVISGIIANSQQSSISYLLNIEELKLKQEQSTKDLLVKDKQIAVDTQRIASMIVDDTLKNSQKTIAEAQSTKDIAIKDKQISVSEKQIEGFEKDMFFKAGGIAKELLYMLAQAGATDGYEWNSDVIKLAIEKMTDGKINITTPSGGTTTVAYDGDGTPNYGLGN